MTVAANVLVVARETAGSDDLIDALRHRVERSPARFHLLMPATEIGLAGRDACKPRLEEALSRWREAGLEGTGETGDRDPLEAVAETWHPGRFDEVIVCTFSTQRSR